MQVQCPQCSSRYKLPDEKIRPSGTKVRCPRCQHAFYVHPASSPEQTIEKPFRAPPPAQVVSPPPPPQKPVAPPAPIQDRPFARKPETIPEPSYTVESSIPDYVESARTVVSTLGDIAKLDEKRTTSPFKALSEAKIAIEDFPRQPEFPEDLSPEQQKENNPFGAATFAEIQNIGANKAKKKTLPLFIAAGVLVIAGLIAILVYTPEPQIQIVQQTVDIPPPNIAKIVRPNLWYSDEPSVFQDFLGQMATLPPNEQNKPERRALIAEALILNGMLTGGSDQIVSGLGYASSLIAAYPQNIYGFTGLSTYALLQDDFQTLDDLLKRWPVDKTESVEYLISKLIVESKKPRPNESLNLAKSLLLTHDGQPRVQAAILFAASEDSDQANFVFNDGSILLVAKKMNKYLQNLKSQGISLPNFYKTIEKRITKKGFLTDPASKNEDPKKTVDAPEPQLPQPFELPKPTNNQTATLKANPVPKIPPKSTKLPKADPKLVALNSKTQNARIKAQKLYNQGNERLASNRSDEAVQLFQQALREDPNLSEAYKQLGVIYMGRQQKDKAVRSFKIYLQLKPDGDDKQLVESWITSLQ